MFELFSSLHLLLLLFSAVMGVGMPFLAGFFLRALCANEEIEEAVNEVLSVIARFRQPTLGTS
jgi:hypothetical protein